MAVTSATVPRGRRGGKFRAVFFASISAMAATIALVLVLAITARYRIRTDLSIIGGQRLSQRTASLLSQLDPGYRIVIAAELSIADRRARERLMDVLDEIARQSGSNLQCTLLDTATPAGTRDYQQLVQELVNADAALFRDQTATLEKAGGTAQSLSAFTLGTLSPALRKIEESISILSPAGESNRSYFSQTAAALRLSAQDLARHGGAASDHLRTRLGNVALPRTDLATSELAAGLAPVIEQLSAHLRELKKFSEGADRPAALAKELLAPVQQQRDQAAIALDSIRRLKRPDILRIVDALAGQSAALIIGPAEKGVCAVEVQSLLPPTAWLDATTAGTADQSRRIEEVLASGLAGLLSPQRPIVVLVHGETREFLNDTPVLSIAKQRLESRGMDLVEWACVVSPQMPRIAEIDPAGARPVVYVFMSADSASGSDQAKVGMSGVQRSEKLGATLARLINDGANVLVSLNPSLIPTYGEKDPLNTPLAAFGVFADTGRPILRERMSGATRIVDTDQILQSDSVANPIAIALKGLPTAFAWPIAIFDRPDLANPEDHAETVTLFSIKEHPSTWLESQWLRLWQTPREQRGLLTDLPTFDEGRDVRNAGTEPRYSVAVAAKRSPSAGKVQRCIIIGTNSWLIDPITGRQVSIDGRTVAANPGNLELLEASVYYLAGQDQLIAQSAAAQPVPMVQMIDDEKRQQLRLVLILGLPLLTMLIGAVVYLIRR